MTIHFYRHDEGYGGFSNFAPFGFTLDGKAWPTAEHYYQAQKHAGAPYEEQIRAAATPKEAAALGRDPAHPLRPDWPAVKDDVMRAALRAKFEAHSELTWALVWTRNRPLVEASPDAYWGSGVDGQGRNRLGELLMELRAELLPPREQIMEDLYFEHQVAYDKGINPALDAFMRSLRAAGFTWSDRNVIRTIRTFLAVEKEPEREPYALDSVFFERVRETLTRFILQMHEVYQNPLPIVTPEMLGYKKREPE